MNDKEIIDKLANLDRRISNLEEKMNFIDNISLSTKGLFVLAEKVGVKEDRLIELFDFRNEELNLIKTLFQDENYKVRTHNISIIILIGYRYILNIDPVLSGEIQRILRTQEVSLSNYNNYMGEIAFNLVIGIEAEKSQDHSYRLTSNGEREAIKLIKEIFESE